MHDTLKRIMDLLGAIFILALFSPLLLLVAIAIVVDSPGPVIYRQRRVGKNGKLFYIWKFRSMYDHAENVLAKNRKFMGSLKKKEGWKLAADEDPRITRVGRFIRKYTLDEFPNLYNIFAGDMSVVGPRAYRNDDLFGDEISQQLKFYPDVPHLKDEVKVALSVKPGMTGPWQVGGRNKLTFDKRVQLDAAYARRNSLLYDIFILFKTPLAMLNKW